VDSFAPCNGSTAFGVVYNFVGCTFESFANGIVYGTDVQGISVMSCNFTQGGVGIACPSGGKNLDQLSVMSSQFGELANAILLNAKLNCTMVSANLFIVGGGQNGIVLNSDSSTINGNVFAGTGPSNNNGVYVSSSIQAVITGNSFSDLTTGVALISGVSGVNVQSNSYRSVATPVFNGSAGPNQIGGGSA